MKDFCIQFSFAATFSAAVVMLAVACWNEGCNQQVSPATTSGQISELKIVTKYEPQVIPLNSGTVERPALLIVPPSLSPESKP